MPIENVLSVARGAKGVIDCTGIIAAGVSYCTQYIIDETTAARRPRATQMRTQNSMTPTVPENSPDDVSRNYKEQAFFAFFRSQTS
jgi:alcohol dehydrogenase YqhD (iron-dependent ADH family)